MAFDSKKRKRVLDAAMSKVPEVTLAFWVIKIMATTLGETGGDAVSMSLHFGYAVGTLIFAVVFAVAVAWQIRREGYHPLPYWLTIVATTTVGTTMADFADRSLGIGYLGGSLLLLALVAAALAAWRYALGTVSVKAIVTPKAEMFYWLTILASNTLGTALGDWLADDTGLGYQGGALVFALGLAVLAGLYYTRRVSPTVLFWLAFILTRPLGATLGDTLTKPLANGGLDLSRFTSSAALAAAMVALIVLVPRRAGKH